MVLSLQDGVDLRQPHDQLLLLLLPAEQRRHLLLQVAHDVGVHLREGEESRGEAKKLKHNNRIQEYEKMNRCQLLKYGAPTKKLSRIS